MAKKRKSDAAYLDEIDRSIYTTFCAAANSLSHFYTQAMNHQRLSFQTGERHSLEKLYQWILIQQEEGSRPTTIDIVAYLQNELEYAAEEPLQHQHSQTGANSGGFVCSNHGLPTNIGQGGRAGNSKNSVFPNSSSSLLRRNFQHHHLLQARNGESDSLGRRESMDVHESSPGLDFLS